MPVWKARYPGVENLKVAVMGCIVNGPGESKHADIGISLPGTGEAPAAPVFIDGEKALTLRGDRMWEFLDRLVSVALPRVRDFKGVSPKAFDGRGNYTLGIREQIIFPEVNYDAVEKISGLNVTVCT